MGYKKKLASGFDCAECAAPYLLPSQSDHTSWCCTGNGYHTLGCPHPEGMELARLRDEERKKERAKERAKRKNDA